MGSRPSRLSGRYRRWLRGVAEIVGGIDDHVHLLVGLKATHCLSDFLRELKKSSSAWVHEQIKLEKFAWQVGYAAFTVSPTARDGVTAYIRNQREHHKKQSSLDELKALLQAAGIEYVPKYLE